MARRAMSPSPRTPLQAMRSFFTDALHANPTAYHPTDIARVQTCDWQLQRYLDRSATPTEAFTKLNATLLWKHSTGLHEQLDGDFPRQFYQLNGVEILGRHHDAQSKSGRLVLWTTCKYSRDFADLKPAIKTFLLHELEALDAQAGSGGLLVVADSAHLGLFSVDLELTRYMGDIASAHYPGLLRQMIIFNLSFLLEPIYRLALAFLGPEIRSTIAVVSARELSEYLDAAFIPVAFGGTRKETKVRLPAGAPSFMEMPSLKLTDAQKEHYKRLLEENWGIDS